MRAIESITLIFENTQSLTIPSKYILQCNFSNHKKEVMRVACNAILEVNYFHNAILMLDSKVKDLKFEPDFNDDLLKRIDITSIELHYDDKISETYQVPWSGEYENQYQTNVANDSGDILIYVSDNLRDIIYSVNDYKDLFYNIEEMNLTKKLITED